VDARANTATASITAVGGQQSGSNPCEVLITAVRKDKPKMLSGLDQNGAWSGTGAALSPIEHSWDARARCQPESDSRRRRRHSRYKPAHVNITLIIRRCNRSPKRGPGGLPTSRAPSARRCRRTEARDACMVSARLPTSVGLTRCGIKTTGTGSPADSGTNTGLAVMQIKPSSVLDIRGRNGWPMLG
jgi:hypothetical protein